MDKSKDRAFPRLNLSCDIEYTIDNISTAHNQPITNSKTKDISLGGMCFVSYSELPMGTQVSLKFKLKNEQEPIILKGEIVWNQMFQIGGQKGWDNGLEFIDIPEKDKARIKKYINSLL